MRFGLLFAMVLVSYCAAQWLDPVATRTPNPVAIAQPGDLEADCAELWARRYRNRVAAGELAGADEDAVDGDLPVGVRGALLITADSLGIEISNIDLSDADQIELRAFRRRSERLGRLLKSLGC